MLDWQSWVEDMDRMEEKANNYDPSTLVQGLQASRT